MRSLLQVLRRGGRQARVCGVVGALACSLAGCGPNADNERVVDAIIVATDQVYDAIEQDGTWLITGDDGAEVKGTLVGAGELEVYGWRSGAEQATDNQYHLAFAERLTLTFSNWTAADVTLNGTVNLTRHSLDVGPPEGTSITDASRTTVYKGVVTASGGASGGFDVDVHGQASGTLLWTCGTVNDQPYGVGSCY